MFSRLPMYQQKGKSAYNGKLDTIKGFTDFLDHPEHQFKSIHVAGTNGKGSSSHMLASILQEAGFQVGLYTSPHLKDYRERIKIDGKPISKAAVIDFISKNRAFLEENELSFFEMSVGLAFDHFAKRKVDIAVIEVGLGGRLDSTNIITPEVSLITNIGLDHVDLLGKTLREIAYEKAGIIKEGVPVIVSERQEEVADVFEAVAKERNTTIGFASNTITSVYQTALLGHYQNKNVKGVIAALKALNGFEITERHVKAGLHNVVANTGLLGRWQILRHNPKVVCDTAHNEEGLRVVLRQLLDEEFNRLHFVLGFVKDKNLDSILPLFPKKAAYYLAQPQIPRGLEVEKLVEKTLGFGLESAPFDSVVGALDAALRQAEKDDVIFVGGSTFTVAEVL